MSLAALELVIWISMGVGVVAWAARHGVRAWSRYELALVTRQMRMLEAAWALPGEGRQEPGDYRELIASSRLPTQ